MQDQPWYFVSFTGELTPGERQALTRPGWSLFENAERVPGAADPSSETEWRHFVRLQAAGLIDAMRSVADALGDEPDGIRAFPAKRD